MSAVFFEDLRKDKNFAHTSVSVSVENKNKCTEEIAYKGFFQRDTCIKGLIWPPLEPKTESCFSSISIDWFIRRITQV